MPASLQSFLAAATRQAAADLITALEQLPDEKRGWSPLGKGRSAVDQAAECAILNGITARAIVSLAFPPDFDFAAYEAEKKAMATDWPRVKALLQENAEKAAQAILGTPDDCLDRTLDLPWGPMLLTQVMAYPYWNMTYHEGQTNYVGSLA